MFALQRISLLVAVFAWLSGSALTGTAQAQHRHYLFTPITYLGDPVPSPDGGTFINDFEPTGINNSGEIVFAADMSTGGEGVFVAKKGLITQIARSGDAAPGGGIFGPLGVFGAARLNEAGDVALDFGIAPGQYPLGLGGGTFLYAHSTDTLSALVLSGITPVPGGGVFEGAAYHAALNNPRSIAFTGIVDTPYGIHIPGEPYLGLGSGIWQVDNAGQISAVAAPGDPAPGGSTFDFAQNPAINDRGDVVFGGHRAGDEIITLGDDQSVEIFTAENVYVRWAATGAIQSIAHDGDPAPGGGTYRLAFGGIPNSRGEIAFTGDVTPSPGTGMEGVFLYTGGKTIAVARPGDLMPGGGHIVTTSFYAFSNSLNNKGDVAFLAALDTGEEGAYVWSRGVITLVARTGTVIPDVGTVASLEPPGFPQLYNGSNLNDRGQVEFAATLADGREVLLVATPTA